MLEIKNIHKKLNDFAIRDVSLNIERGEYFIIVGKSGAGKTLLLELLAGLIYPDSGEIILEEKAITRERIQHRQIGMVFQDNTLFPHLSVRDNIMYALHSIKYPHERKKEIVTRIARDLEVEHLLGRGTSSLSGGEASRVALARALVMKPKILLLDEPLVSLDTQLRSDMRKLLKKLHLSGQTIIHVTHDYEETVSLADRIAVINRGEIVQSGTPEAVFQRPASEFVASFIGIKNFFTASLSPDEKTGTTRAQITGDISLSLPGGFKKSKGYIFIRGEDIILSRTPATTSATNVLKGKVTGIYPATRGIEISVDAGIQLASIITKASLKSLDIKEDDDIWVIFKAAAVKFVEE